MLSSSAELMEKETHRCTVCGSAAIRFLGVYDDRYGYPGTYQIYHCRQCGHKFLPADFTAAQMTKLYTDFYPRSTFDLGNYRPSKPIKGFRSWLNGEHALAYTWVPENVRVLDIGCGFGETLGYHKARGCDVYGVEADKNIERVAKLHGFTVHVGVFDPAVYEPDFFDYVTMDQVIEHMADPVDTLKGVARILKKNGVAIISTPNAGGWGARLFRHSWVNWHAPYHRQFFSRRSITAAAENVGFVVQTVRTVTSSEWLFYQWIHVLSRPGEGMPSPFWSPRVKRSWRAKAVLGISFVIHLTKINHVLARLFDSLGVGDNYLFILKKA